MDGYKPRPDTSIRSCVKGATSPIQVQLVQDGIGERQIFLSTAPAGRREHRLALAVVMLSLAIFVGLAPFARLPLPQVWAFIPIYESALIVSDLITALLLFAQYTLLRSRPLLVLGCAYLFCAAMIVPHAASFPGLFAPAGLLGGGAQTTAWLYFIWHGGFPLAVIAYAWLKSIKQKAAGQTGSAKVVAAGIAAVVAVAVILTLVTTSGHEILPDIMAAGGYTATMQFVSYAVWLLSPAALVVLWLRRPHSLLDLWLMVVLCAWFFDVGLSAALNGGRFDLGFYAGLIYGLVAATFVLGMLLFDLAALYDLRHGSAEGGGTVFHLDLPRHRMPADTDCYSISA